MSARSFDTYEYVQTLIQGGFTPQLAEANMHALVKALDFTIENHVVAKLEQFEIKLDQFTTQFVTQFATKEELRATREELRQEIQQVEHRLEAKIQNLDHKIDQVFLKTVVSTGGMITIACSILGFLIKF